MRRGAERCLSSRSLSVAVLEHTVVRNQPFVMSHGVKLDTSMNVNYQEAANRGLNVNLLCGDPQIPEGSRLLQSVGLSGSFKAYKKT